MKKNALLFFGLLIAACYKELPAPADPLLCTENFVTYTLEIPGDPLDAFFTYREATGDSFGSENTFPDATRYPVLNDRYKDSLVGANENFVFVGRQGETSFEVPFVFTSDRCHIVKISGPDFYNPRGE